MTDQRDTPDSGGAFARAPHMAVDAKGYVWRVFDRGTDDEMWSMAPVNADNGPIPQPVTWYAPVPSVIRGGDAAAWGRAFKSMHLLAELLHDPAFGEGTLIMARNQARIMLNRWNEAVDSELDAAEEQRMSDTPDTRTPSAEPRCHNGHPFEPGVSEDNAPSDLWCNVCGERRRTEPAPLGDATTGAEPTEEASCADERHRSHFPAEGSVWGVTATRTDLGSSPGLLWAERCVAPAPSACVNCGHLGTYHDDPQGCQADVLDDGLVLVCECRTFRAVGAAPPTEDVAAVLTPFGKVVAALLRAELAGYDREATADEVMAAVGLERLAADLAAALDENRQILLLDEIEAERNALRAHWKRKTLPDGAWEDRIYRPNGERVTNQWRQGWNDARAKALAALDTTPEGQS